MSSNEPNQDTIRHNWPERPTMRHSKPDDQKQTGMRHKET